MLFFYIRHGDPIYSPDSLTALGEEQAKAVAKRLAVYGLDHIYSSSSNRAIQTAKPTSELLKKDIEILDFANENYAWNELTIEKNGRKSWLFEDEEIKMLFADNSIISLGHFWYENTKVQEYKKGIERISKETFAFFELLGYERINNTGKYKVKKTNEERIAFFCTSRLWIGFFERNSWDSVPFVCKSL